MYQLHDVTSQEASKLHNHCRENPIIHILRIKLVLMVVWILRKRIF